MAEEVAEAADKTLKALHFSEGKVGVDQLPVEVLQEWASVFTFGEKKYARDNWKKGTDYHQFYGSALRHIFKWWAGEDVDPESGINHIAHALWNLAALRYYQIHGLGTDDRNPLPNPENFKKPVEWSGQPAAKDTKERQRRLPRRDVRIKGSEAQDG